MSLYGSLYSGVSSLGAQGTAIAMVSDNISNLNTIGYKGTTATFSTLVTQTSSSAIYASGGVMAKGRTSINQQGLLKATGIDTDLGISGDGFFVINTKDDLSGEYMYTRAGSYGTDAKGNYKNSAGFFLLAWPLDNEGRLPGKPGNTDTTSNSLLDSLQVVNLKTVSGAASQTTKVSFGINLKESETVLEGSGDTISFSALAGNNYKIDQDDVIVPDASAGYEFNIGDSLTLNPSNPGVTYTFTYGGLANSADITGGVLGAVTPNLTFSAATTGDNFTIANATSGTVTFTYKASSPSVSNGEFNTLLTLAEAINRTTGLSARVKNNILYVSPVDSREGMTFTDVTGTFVAALGFTNTTSVTTDRFATLYGLKELINTKDGLKASIINPLSTSSLKFYAIDPLGTLTVNATAAALPSTATSILTQLGLTLPAGTVHGPEYDATNEDKNIASGNITPHFTHNQRVYDAFGTYHDFRISFVKIDTNIWSVEIYSAHPEEIISSRTDGQISSGNIEFNGDGSLRNVDASLSIPIEVSWSNEALTSAITFNWGTAGAVAGTVGALSIGKSDGLRQLDASYNVTFSEQNGINAGLLNGVTVDKSGYIIANFSNGTNRKIYKVALAQFTNSNGLASRGGNAYVETTESGNYNLKEPDTGGVGSIESATLEQPNVDLADELTKMIVAQNGYQASSKVIKTVNEMLGELTRMM